ncbi:MAG: 50S ribosomal protein L25 [Chloroflexi bacterium]|nr:50S ribosomal protein L25 [Chloroflexota bacterium]MBM3155088.1 50S ribosomal protein L25 [Chloroflexota bacterium]MBM3173761.1 50S ribosomal protein L25 [Chloroflexota bacterium]MBM3174853.1 50S ribosomal protein L25 [Chloroflexota bacterium]MBM4450910.1 50S ribosomal protein L25 [Chloroflexota bacterium]
MKGLELEVAKRTVTGKKVRFLRRGGIVPGNIYGHGIDSISIQADAKTLRHLLAHAGQTDLISLKVAGAKSPTKVLVREVQRNPINDELLHVEFYQVRMTEKIKTDVPLVFVGEAPVLKKIKNSSLMHIMDSLRIEALPDDLPHNFEVDVSGLEEIDHVIYVKDIPLSKGVTLLSDEEQVVVKAVEARKVEEEVVEAAPAEAAEVEVVGKEREGEVEGEEEAEEK